MPRQCRSFFAAIKEKVHDLDLYNNPGRLPAEFRPLSPVLDVDHAHGIRLG